MKAFIATLTAKKIANLLKNRLSYGISCLTRRAKIGGLPVSLSVEPAAVCQLHCPECIVGMGKLKRQQKFIDPAFFAQIINESADTLCYLLLYFQGEPLLAPHIFDMIAYANHKNIYTATSTNAQCIDQHFAEKIVESGLKKIIISLDGVTQESYEQYRVGGKIEKVFDAIELIAAEKRAKKSRFPEIEVQFIVFRHNEHEIARFLQLKQRFDVQKISVKSAQIYNFDQKNSRIPKNAKYSRYSYQNNRWIRRKPTRNRCLRQWQGAVITTNGDFLPCCFDKNGENLFGNVQNASIAALWHGTEAAQFRQHILDNRSEIEICGNCSE